MRQLDDDELLFLRAVARAFCKESGLQMKVLADEAGKASQGKPAAAAGKKSGRKAKDPCDVIEAFLLKGSGKKKGGVRRCAPAILAAIRTHAEENDLPEYVEIVSLFEKSENFTHEAAAEEFLAGRRQAIGKALFAELETVFAGADTDRARFKKRVGRIFYRLARQFDSQDRDVDVPALNSGFRAANGEGIGNHYVLVRSSSLGDGLYVVHGLKIAPHEDAPDLLYFSEEYRIEKKDSKHIHYRSRGLCFFDGQYLTALARPDDRQSITFILGFLNEPRADVFEAMISTSNSRLERIGARGICLRCADEAEKHRKVGVFSREELLNLFEGEQRTRLESWKWLKHPDFSVYNMAW